MTFLVHAITRSMHKRWVVTHMGLCPPPGPYEHRASQPCTEPSCVLKHRVTLLGCTSHRQPSHSHAPEHQHLVGAGRVHGAQRVGGGGATRVARRGRLARHVDLEPKQRRDRLPECGRTLLEHLRAFCGKRMCVCLAAVCVLSALWCGFQSCTQAPVRCRMRGRSRSSICFYSAAHHGRQPRGPCGHGHQNLRLAPNN